MIDDKSKINEVKKNRKLEVRIRQENYSVSTQIVLNDELHVYDVAEPIHQNSILQKRDVKFFCQDRF